MSQKLQQGIAKAVNQNWSIIPLEGDGDNAKRPARDLGSWSRYQTVRPTEDEIHTWLANDLTAYGIIMGDVSGGLFCIDFDVKEHYYDFRRTFNKLANTYTVRTRKGYHVYFYAPIPVKTTRFDGGDIIGEGSYVVGAGSTITQTSDDEDITTTYEVFCNASVKTLTDEQWQAIQEHLGIQTQTPTTTTTPRLLAQSNQAEILIAQYEKGIQRDGRNNTLYRVAVQAKHSNINESDTIAILADHHARTATSADHPTETYEQRYTEAIRTIQSAYKTSGNLALQPLVAPETAIEGQLPNSLREALLRATARLNDAEEYVGTSAVMARLIEGLHREGYLGTIASAKTIGKVATKYKIDKESLNKALEGKYNGLKLLRKVSYSDKNTPPVGEGERNQMFYAIPSLENLLKRFNVVPQAVDVLSDDDLCSNKKYVQAMHREFIKRSGGDTSTAYCAARLSVTERTILNYDNALDIVKTAVVQYESLSWHNVDKIDFPAQDDTGITPGIWLQREDGKRFPAIKGIALNQLKDGANLILCMQKPSVRYLYEEGMTYHDVWWVAPDGSRWGGGELDFPPEATTIYTPPAPIEPVTEPTIVPKRQRIDDSEMAQAYYRATFEERDRQRVAHIVEQVQQARQTQVFSVEPRINESLTLIKGIGERIDEQLGMAGIDHMTDLIGIGAETVASIFHYNTYISTKTTQGWIDQAELLLGLREKTPDEIAQERAQERAEALKQYKNAYGKLQTFVDDLLADEERDNIVLQRFKQQLDIWTEHPNLFTFIKFDEVQTRVLAELEAYLDHIQTFLDADADWLARWNFGTTKHWRKRAGQVQKLLAIWKSLSLDG